MNNNYEIYNPYSNQEVTSFYVEMIEEAVRSKKCQINYVPKLSKKRENKKIVLIVVSMIDVLKGKAMGYKHIILWIQGIIPEESYMRNQSKLRFWALSKIEKIAIKKASRVIVVSNEMINHLQNKYKIKMNNVFVMPCFNENIDKSAFEEEDKYKNNTFVYIGGLSKWQRFDDIIRIYRFIEQNVPDTSLLVFTKQIEEARQIIMEHNVERYTVDYVKPDELSKRIKCAKFGFVIREDCAVNRVATPTKLSNYLANGIIPIYSECLTDFHSIMSSREYSISLHSLFEREELEQSIIKSAMMNNIDYKEVFKEYKKIFDSYYSRQLYVGQLIEFLGEIG